MSEASRPEAGVRTVVCYALCGPPIGVWSVYLLTQASAALASVRPLDPGRR